MGKKESKEKARENARRSKQKQLRPRLPQSGPENRELPQDSNFYPPHNPQNAR